MTITREHLAGLELLPCPFCGSKADLHQFTHKHWSVNCSACGAAMISGSTKRDAIENWNTRAQAAPEAEPVAHVTGAGWSGLGTGKPKTHWVEISALKMPMDGEVKVGAKLYLAPQHDAELVELLKFASVTMAVTAKSSAISDVERRSLLSEVSRIDAKLATLRHV